jgi:hypothetical protein
MLNVVMLNVIMLSVVAPRQECLPLTKTRKGLISGLKLQPQKVLEL